MAINKIEIHRMGKSSLVDLIDFSSSLKKVQLVITNYIAEKNTYRSGIVFIRLMVSYHTYIHNAPLLLMHVCTTGRCSSPLFSFFSAKRPYLCR